MDLDNNDQRLMQHTRRKMRQPHITSLLLEVRSTAYRVTFPNLKRDMSIHKNHRVLGAYKMTSRDAIPKFTVAKSTGQVTWFLMHIFKRKSRLGGEEMKRRS